MVDELERMSHEEAKKATELVAKIAVAIEKETDYTYQDVMRALNMIEKHYERKSKDFLNSIKIQEISRYGGLLS